MWVSLALTSTTGRLRSAKVRKKALGLWDSRASLAGLHHEVGPWLELPLWLPDPDWAGMHATDVSRAVDAGLRFRPLAETLKGAATAQLEDGVGLTPEREAELLEAWQSR